MNLVRFVEVHFIFLEGFMSKVTAADFTEEIYYALKDCFVAKIVCTENEITFKFVNGQIFVISIKEL